MTDNALTTWSVLMPVKVLAQAKSRLAALAGSRRAEFALALACDTVAAVLGCDQAARVIVITDDQVAGPALAKLGALVVPDEPRDGLNAALRHGAAHATARWPGDGTAALSADLPALRPDEIGLRGLEARVRCQRIRFCSLQRCFIRAHVRRGLHVFQLRQQLALLHLIAFLHVQVGNFSKSVRADVDVGLGLDFARSAHHRRQIFTLHLAGLYRHNTLPTLEHHEPHAAHK